ncbi:MAG: hypothetical protein QOI38_1035 [Sphingomonadales bacterium]|nr:hypothetical protein [Sphingomonadales bacterium]
MKLSGTLGGAPLAIDVRSDKQERTFRVDVSAAAGPRLVREYRVRGGSHAEYVRVFEALAHDFQMRVPLSHLPPRVDAAPPGLRVLLSESLVPEILYGYGDPAMVRVAGTPPNAAIYYLAVTSNDAPHSVPILKSSDLEHWTVDQFAFPPGKNPPWAARDGDGAEFWAPEIHRVGDRFVLCFAARDPKGALAIGLAVAESPGDGFVPQPQPLKRGGVIDPHIHVEPNGDATVYWKRDSNDRWPGMLARLLRKRPDLMERLFDSEASLRTAAFAATLSKWAEGLSAMERFLVLQTLIEAVVEDFAGFRARLEMLRGEPALERQVEDIIEAMRTIIYGQALDPETLSVRGTPAIVLENDEPWEAHLVEGPWVWREGDLCFIFYAGNDFTNANYGIGVGVSPSPLGPFVKQEKPLLRSTHDWWGLGHPSVARAPDGKSHLFLHGYRRGRVGYKEFRALLDVPLCFEGGRVTTGA